VVLPCTQMYPWVGTLRRSGVSTLSSIFVLGISLVGDDLIVGLDLRCY
jgi:hypothetical protein